MQEQVKAPEQEKRVFRLIVSNASEAVALIQKKFGTTATVQSVKQHQPKGMTKLWSNPKLEIVVSIPNDVEAAKSFQLPSPDQQKVSSQDSNTEVSEESAMPDVEEVTRPSSEKQTPFSAHVSDSNSSTAFGAELSSMTVEDILLQSDFDKTLVQRLKNLPQWATINQRSPKQGLTELVTLLREEFLGAQNLSLSPYTAFVGTPGVGKSTILRKTVANRVFVHGKKVQVLKLDDEDPNPDDFLSVFCEVIGVDLVRSPSDLKLESGTEIFVDIPGITLNQPERVRYFKSQLDELKIQSRVLVMNSLYDSRSLTKSYDLGRHLGVTHQSLTHLDELDHWAKLWKFVLKGSHPLVFLNLGDESSAAPKEEFLPLLVSKTFPKILQN